MVYFYIVKTDEWDNIYKYGITNNYNNRLNNSHEEHISLKKYTHLFKLKCNDNIYNETNYKDIDKYISIIARDIKLIKKFEDSHNIKLKNMYLINNYLLNMEGGKEFIKGEGIPILIDILQKDFKYLGITIKKVFTRTEIEDININILNKWNKNIKDNKKTKLNMLKSLLKTLPKFRQDFTKEEITNSDILQVTINNKLISINKYSQLLAFIIEKINIKKGINVKDIIDLISFNYKIGDYNKEGYKYREKLKISIQNKDAYNTLKAIQTLITHYNYSLIIKIKTITLKEINYHFN